MQPYLGQWGEIYGDWRSQYSAQFLLSYNNQTISFHRNKKTNQQWWLLTSSTLPFIDWTHIVITWQHVTGEVCILADGKVVAKTTYTVEAFNPPSGEKYRISNDEGDFREFRGSVMDLYVFDKALSQDEINKLRGKSYVIYVCILYRSLDLI